MAEMKGIRWAFKCGAWQPTKHEWQQAARATEQEEKDRIGRFVFQRDAKSAMAGRLLIRKAISDLTGIPYNQAELTRTDKGKPFLKTPTTHLCSNFNFNVSHQGDYAVIAAEPANNVGVDIMEVTWPRGNRKVKEFFDTMHRQFTEFEWQFIEAPTNDWSKLQRFYRLWCLKESYVKTLGIGIGFSLQRIEFHPTVDFLTTDSVTADTTVFVDGSNQRDWAFQETMLDQSHCVVTALKGNVNVSHVADGRFTVLSFEDLIAPSIPLTSEDEQYWIDFNNKKLAPGM